MPPAALPRKMLPPPMTMPTSTCWSRTLLTWRAMVLTVSWSMPKPCSPMRASPLSFRRTRQYLGASAAPVAIAAALGLAFTGGEIARGRLPHPETREPGYDDVLFELNGGLVDEVLDFLLVVLGPLLLHQAVLLEVGVELALGDLFGDRLLPLLVGLGDSNVSLAPDHRLRHLLSPNITWRPAGDLDRELAGQLPEDVIAGHEVRLAVDLDHGCDLVVVMHVGTDHALPGRPARTLLGLGDPFLAQPILGLLEVALGDLESFAGVEDAGVGGVAKLLDKRCRNLGHQASPIILSWTSRPSRTFSNSSSWISGSGFTSSSSLSASKRAGPAGSGMLSAAGGLGGAGAISGTVAAVTPSA